MKIKSTLGVLSLNALVDDLDGAGPHVKIYSAPTSVPATITATKGTDAVQLADITLHATTAFGGAAVNTAGTKVIATANATAASETSATAGTAAFFRVYKSAAAATTAAVIQGTCGTATTADMVLNSTAISAGATVKITSWKINQPLSS